MKHDIHAKYILIAAIIAAIYFLLLFLNVGYSYIKADSFMAVFIELLTIPFIALEFSIAIHCSIRYFYRKERKISLLISLVLALIAIIAMFVIK